MRVFVYEDEVENCAYWMSLFTMKKKLKTDFGARYII